MSKSIKDSKNKPEYFRKELELNNPHFTNGIFTLESEYVSSKQKVLLKNKYGLCMMSPGQLKRGNKPDISNAIDKIDYLKNMILDSKGREHFKKYEIVEYRGSLEILLRDSFGDCRMTLNSLILGYKPSIECAVDKDKYFLSKLKKTNNKLDYKFLKILSKYKNNKTPIYVQDYYSIYKLTPSALLKIDKLDIISAVDKTEYFINKYSKNNLIYEGIHYKNGNSLLTIKCGKHNIYFNQTANNHKACNICCPMCINLSSYIFEQWNEIRKGKEGIFYILKCFNKTETFLKIGITCTTIKERYYNKVQMPYEYEILHTISRANRRIVWDLENNIKEEFSNRKYKPNIFFKGSVNECFNYKYLEDILLIVRDAKIQ